MHCDNAINQFEHFQTLQTYSKPRPSCLAVPRIWEDPTTPLPRERFCSQRFPRLSLWAELRSHRADLRWCVPISGRGFWKPLTLTWTLVYKKENIRDQLCGGKTANIATFFLEDRSNSGWNVQLLGDWQVQECRRQAVSIVRIHSDAPLDARANRINLSFSPCLDVVVHLKESNWIQLRKKSFSDHSVGHESELWKSKAGVLVYKDRGGFKIDLATGQNWYIKGKGPSPPPPRKKW